MSGDAYSVRMRRVLVVLLVLGLLGGGTALAGRGDPQERIVRADQARAKAMLLRASDLGPGFRATPTPSGTDFYCKALDESDLTVTGKAQSPTFIGGVQSFTSVSRVYESRPGSAASWRRGTSQAGISCLRAEFLRLFAAQGGQLESFRRIALPKLAERSAAYRLTVLVQGLRAYLDVVALKQGRAQASLLMVSALTPVARAEQLRLARVVARRMKAAMRAG